MGSWKAPSIVSSETVLIVPESATAAENRHLKLSNLDCLEMRFYTPVILLYDAPSADFEFQAVVARLKESLSKALVEYYPFAGRFAKGDDGSEEVRCDDTGAFFTEAVVEETLAEVGGFEGCVLLSGMEAAGLRSSGLHSLDDHDEIPPLVVQTLGQVTSFKCKPIAVAANWHHQVCDGGSGMTFLKAWSELARGLPISSPPDHRRHLQLECLRSLSVKFPRGSSCCLKRCNLGPSMLNLKATCVQVRWSSSSLDMPLGHLAERIHDSILGVTDEYVRSVVDYIEVTGAANLA